MMRLLYALGTGEDKKFREGVETVETLKWSWKEAGNGWHSTRKAMSGNLRSLSGWQATAVIAVIILIMAPFMMLVFGFRGPAIPEDKGTPNIGIQKSVLNAVVLGLATGIVGFFPFVIPAPFTAMVWCSSRRWRCCNQALNLTLHSL